MNLELIWTTADAIAALREEMRLARNRVDNPVDKNGNPLSDNVQSFNRETLARLQTIEAGFKAMAKATA